MTRLSKPVATIETLKHLVSNSDKKYATKDSLSKVATTGNYSDLKGTPTSLKNPNAISFTGGSTASYDGSKSVSVAIPTSLPANGGNASTVNGHTVLSNVPANAKFTDTVYSLPDASTTTKGGVKVGSNITVDTGTISLTKDNVTGALGYTPPTHDTHYMTGLKVGATASATSNAIASNGNVYLNVLDNYTVRDSHKIVGAGATTVTSDANGVITISSTDTNTVYTHPSTHPASMITGLAKVATSGSYADLSNKPTIPTSLPANGGTATKALQDGNGNNIVSTYRTKSDSYSLADTRRLFECMVPYGTNIPEKANLNTVTYLKVGNYYCSLSATTSTITNCPVQDAFMMRVYSPLSTTIDNETSSPWVYRVREIMTLYGVAYRQYVSSSATAGTFSYSAWKQVAFTSDIPTSLPANGGNSTTVNNHTVNSDVPANAKFTDTVYTHPNSGVTAGTYKSVTVNAQGHVTAGTNPTTLSGYGITDAKISNGVITLGANSITPLTSHQSLSNYYTKGEVNSQISSIPKFAIAVVTDLPTANISNTTIYLKKTGSDTQNLYTEYIYVNSKWEQLGTQKLDLSGYLTKTDASNTYLGKYTAAISANKLNSNAGSATQPIYFSKGVPVACTYTLGKSVPSDAKFTDTVYYHPSTHPASMITGLATVATSGSYTDLSDRPTLGSAASKDVRNSTTLGTIGWTNNATSAEVVPTINTLAYWNGAFNGTTSNLAYCAKGAFGSIVTKNAGDYAAAGHTHYYAGSSSVGGAATSANKLNTNAGSSTTPTYFYNGVPVACTGISVATVTATTTLNIPGGKIWIE